MSLWLTFIGGLIVIRPRHVVEDGWKDLLECRTCPQPRGTRNIADHMGDRGGAMEFARSLHRSRCFKMRLNFVWIPSKQAATF